MGHLFDVTEYAVFTVEGHYFMACNAVELEEVMKGGAFWAEPRALTEAEALELLAGRTPTALNLSATLAQPRRTS